MKKFKVNQPDGTPCEVIAKNKKEAFGKFVNWIGDRFKFSIKDVYQVN